MPRRVVEWRADRTWNLPRGLRPVLVGGLRLTVCGPETGSVAPSEDFHRDFLPKFIDAQRAFHAGDPEPNIALWATTDPVTLFAVRGKRKRGTTDVNTAFREVSAWFSDLRHYEWEPVVTVVGDDFAYTVCLERYTASIHGGPLEAVEYRSTHVFRREDGRWRAAHRHADRQPVAD
jgi:ketosteroid isomerase-like protein